MGGLVAEAKIRNRATIDTLHRAEGALQTAVFVVELCLNLAVGATVGALDRSLWTELSEVHILLTETKVWDAAIQWTRDDSFGTLCPTVLVVVTESEVQDTTTLLTLDLTKWTIVLHVTLQGTIKDKVSAPPAASLLRFWTLDRTVVGDIFLIKNPCTTASWTCHIQYWTLSQV